MISLSHKGRFVVVTVCCCFGVVWQARRGASRGIARIHNGGRDDGSGKAVPGCAVRVSSGLALSLPPVAHRSSAVDHCSPARLEGCRCSRSVTSALAAAPPPSGTTETERFVVVALPDPQLILSEQRREYDREEGRGRARAERGRARLRCG